MRSLAHDKIAGLRRDADEREAAWLLASDWTHTSQTPGCYWMWLKEWDGKTFMVEQDVAARIQEIWDNAEHARLHLEIYED